MATKDGGKRQTARATPQPPDTGESVKQRRSAENPEKSARRTGATGKSTSTRSKATSTSRRRAPRASASERAEATAPPRVDATAEADLPVTEADVATQAEPAATVAEAESNAGVEETPTPEPAPRLPEELGSDVAEGERVTASDEDVEMRELDGPVDSGEERERLDAASGSQPRWARRERMPHGNALGMLIERQFSAPASPVRSYSDLERRSGISREALSRYVTTRPDRRRSPTIDTLVAIADAMHLSLDATCRAAAATAKGTVLAAPETQNERDAVVSTLIGGLSDDQFSAVVELLRQMRPAGAM